MVSVLAHSTVILAWLNTALCIYAKRKRRAWPIALVSAFTAFVSTVILVQAGWTVSWGSLIIIAGGVLMLARALQQLAKEC